MLLIMLKCYWFLLLTHAWTKHDFELSWPNYNSSQQNQKTHLSVPWSAIKIPPQLLSEKDMWPIRRSIQNQVQFFALPFLMKVFSGNFFQTWFEIQKLRPEFIPRQFIVPFSLYQNHPLKVVFPSWCLLLGLNHRHLQLLFCLTKKPEVF